MPIERTFLSHYTSNRIVRPSLQKVMMAGTMSAMQRILLPPGRNAELVPWDLQTCEQLYQWLQNNYPQGRNCSVGPIARQEVRGDMAVVWGLTSCTNKLNPLMFMPSFFLLTASSYVRRLEPGMEASDYDIGEQFHC
jgi:hypothetical protein